MEPSAARASTGFARAEQTTRGRRRFWVGVFKVFFEGKHGLFVFNKNPRPLGRGGCQFPETD